MEAINTGYKQTELGWIPVDWEVKSIEELCIPSGLVRGPFGGALKKESFVRFGYKVYEQKNAIYDDITLGNYYIDSIKFEELKRFEVKYGDLIVSCSGTIGKISQIPPVFEKGIINQALLKITLDRASYSDQYFLLYFRWPNFQNRITDSTQGGAMKNLIGMSDFKKTKIPLPPLAEQRAIAAALSDADALIQQTEQLLAKKRLLKAGAMQELLRPKEGWVVKRLGEVGSFKKGGNIPKSSIVNEGLPCVLYGEIYTKYDCYSDTLFSRIPEYQSKLSIEISYGDVLFAGSGETAEDIGKCFSYLGKEKAFAGGDIIIFSPQNTSSLFLGYLLNSSEVVKQKSIRAQGSSVYHIYPRDLKEIILFLPSLPEQTRIATILSNMDEEITALEKQLNKYRQLKQGMMQNLLTGKIRLV